MKRLIAKLRNLFGKAPELPESGQSEQSVEPTPESIEPPLDPYWRSKFLKRELSEDAQFVTDAYQSVRLPINMWNVGMGPYAHCSAVIEATIDRICPETKEPSWWLDAANWVRWYQRKEIRDSALKLARELYFDKNRLNNEKDDE